MHKDQKSDVLKELGGYEIWGRGCKKKQRREERRWRLVT